MSSSACVLLFDLGDTLWHFPVIVPRDAVCGRSATQIEPLLRGWGWTGDAGVLARTIYDAVEDAFRAAVRGPLISPDYLDAVDGVVRAAGLHLDVDQLDALWSAWEVDGAVLGRQLYPDTVTTLRWAGAAGYRVGVITNRWHSAARLTQEMAALGLGRFVECVTVSSETGWLKPHPESFHAALAALGAGPDDAVMVGDSLRDDIAGAKRIGMRAVWKRNGRRQRSLPDPLMPPDAMIDDLWELRRLPLLAGA